MQCQNIPNLRRRQVDIACCRFPVRTFTRIAGQHIDCRISLAVKRQLILRFRAASSHGKHHHLRPRHARRFRLLTDSPEKCFSGLRHHLIIAVQPAAGSKFKSRILQTFLCGHEMPYIHVAGARAALDGLPGAAAV